MGVQIDGVNGTIKTGSSNVHNTGYSGQDGSLTGNLTIDGNLGVAGTVTYEDITRVDAVGLSTFREGFGVGPLAGIALTAYKDGSIRTSGIITANTYYGSGANLTGIDLGAVTGATGDFSIADKIVHTGDTDTTIRFPAADTVTVSTAGTERIRFTSDGKIGINNDNPIHAVHIKNVMASSPSYIHMTSTGSNVDGGGGGIAFDTSAANTDETKFIATIAGIRNTESNGSNDLVFSTTKMSVNGGAPTEKLRIGSAGQIGLAGANYGSSGQVLTSGGASAAPSWADAGGVTYIDQWHYTTNQDLSSQDPLTGWTHSTHAANARLGTAMTESSGTWSFPATGMWLVSFSCWYYANARSSRWMQSRINTTENNSSYNQASAASNAIYNTGSNGYNSAYSQFIFDVTNTTNCKVRFSVDSQATLQYMGGRNFTAVKFIRLCGT